MALMQEKIKKLRESEQELLRQLGRQPSMIRHNSAIQGMAVLIGNQIDIIEMIAESIADQVGG